MRPVIRILVVSGLLGVVLSVPATTGCRRSATEEESRRRIVEAYGRLPGLTETPDPELRAELARIVEEKATPERLTRPDIPDEENVAAGLAGLFEPLKIEDPEPGEIFNQSSAILPQGEFRFDPTGLERAIRFRGRYEAQRQAAREALYRPGCHFGVQYVAGFAADSSFVDVVRICARLEAFHAAESLARDDVDAAIESLGSMFRLAVCLGAEKQAVARLEAAFVRLEALAVLQAIVGHPEISRPKITLEQLGRLYAMVGDSLKAWPPDADAWIGDRALGMHAYEAVRAGRLVELLTEEEVKRFAAEEILRELPGAARRNVNQDELYYLETMRTIIEACAEPYYKRRDVFESIRQDLHQKRNSPQFPLVAGRLLLVDIEKGHAVQARDRASCEAWALALAVASGKKRPPYQVSPLSGGEYEIVREDGQVTVAGISPDEVPGTLPVIVPDLAGEGRQK